MKHPLGHGVLYYLPLWKSMLLSMVKIYKN